MLYVFLVSSGTMKIFDINYAVKNVSELQIAIAESMNIPVHEQVLLCSGGQVLLKDKQVSYYGAGTDTNPIFLFSNNINFSTTLYNEQSQSSLDSELEEKVQNCFLMAPTSAAVAVMTAFAQKFSELAKTIRKECDDLVNVQHLQHQGWAAVVANLEDVQESLIQHKSHFDEMFKNFLDNRPIYQQVLQRFPEDIELLSKIPLLPEILRHIEDSGDLENKHSLLDWFGDQPREQLEEILKKDNDALKKVDEASFSSLNNKYLKVIKLTEDSNFKEVKGIAERLNHLNNMIDNAKIIETDQFRLGNWFIFTQNKIDKEPSALPALCKTFKNQLELMLQNYKCLVEILHKCTKAKIELCENIVMRLKYICSIESDIRSVTDDFLIYQTRIQGVNNAVQSLHQIHFAPQRYFQSLAEVYRRRIFSSNFMKWATDLSSQAQKVYEKEVCLRNQFKNSHTENIVDNLFPGLDELPPDFAIHCPKPFDQNLPHIEKENLDSLKSQFPELSSFCEISIPEHIPLISHTETDSAFSSNVRLFRTMENSTVIFGEKLKQDKSELPGLLEHKPKIPTLEECNNLSQGNANVPNEVCSLTSSPFEDPLLTSPELDMAVKSSKSLLLQATKVSVDLETSVPINLRTTIIESDGEEFETLDRYGTSPLEITSHLDSQNKIQSSSTYNSSSASAAIAMNLTQEKRPKIRKPRSDGDAISPIQDRLKCSESLLTSQDFQTTEYFIDDSMPSSYTESNATSPLLRTNQMVKSHHVVVAELQRQMEEKNLSLLQALKYIQELKDNLQGDISSLKSFVKEEFWDDVSLIIEKIHNAMAAIQLQIHLQKEEAQGEVIMLEKTYMQKLEVEAHKLNDAEKQIRHYEDCLQQISLNYDEINHEKKQIEEELNDKKEMIKQMMLEHELELDSLKNEVHQVMYQKDDEIMELQQNLTEKESKLKVLESAATNVEEIIQMKLNDQFKIQEDKYKILIDEKEKEFYKIQEDLKQQHQIELKKFQEVESSKALIHAENIENLREEYEKKIEIIIEDNNDKIKALKCEIEIANKTISELKNEIQELINNHKSELESLRSRFRLAYSSTASSLERLPSNNSMESLHLEKEYIDISKHEKIISEIKEHFEINKNEIIRKLEEEQKLREEDAVKKVIEIEKHKHEKEMKEKITCVEKKYEEIKAHYIAENQVSFNAAINRVTKEKEAIIENLRLQISQLLIQKSSSQPSDEKNFEGALAQSEASLSGELPLSCGHDPETLEPLKKQLKMKQDDLSAKYEKASTSLELCDKSDKTCFQCCSKISCLSCNVGDLVLVCYEEKYVNYIVFHLGQSLHFVHTQSLASLNLKIPPGDTGRAWGLGVVMEKVFCQTKKVANKYKLPLNARFYRVKLQPWNYETPLAIHRTRRHSQTDCNLYALPSEEPASTRVHPTSEDEDKQEPPSSSSAMSSSAI